MFEKKKKSLEIIRTFQGSNGLQPKLLVSSIVTLKPHFEYEPFHFEVHIHV